MRKKATAKASSLHHHHHEPIDVRTERERDNDTGTIRRTIHPPIGGPSKTEQHHKAACDINNIMARYIATGTLEHVRQYEPQYLETSPDDYHTSQNKVAEARSMFEELPARMRAHFNNDPASFLNYCVTAEDPANGLKTIAEEYRRLSLGLADPATQETQTPPPKPPPQAEPSVADKGGETGEAGA